MLMASVLGPLPGEFREIAIDPNRPDPYTVTWNLTVERQLTADTMVQASYVGTRFTHAPNNIAMNLVNPATRLRLDPTIGEIDFSTNGVRSVSQPAADQQCALGRDYVQVVDVRIAPMSLPSAAGLDAS